MNAIMIICHKNIEQIKRLILRCSSSNTQIILHIDKKMDITEKQLSELVDVYGVYLTDIRLSGELDTRSLVDITMLMIEKAKKLEKEKAIHFDYYLLLSGQDYLTKPISYINKKLAESYPMPYIDCTEYAKSNWLNRKFKTTVILSPCVFRVKRLFPSAKHPIRILERIIRGAGEVISDLFKQSNYHKLKRNGVNIYGGSAWWILPDKAIDYIRDEYKENKDYLKYIFFSYTPEETFFQTVAMRSPIKDFICINSPDFIGQNCKTWAYFFDESKPPVSHPYIFTKEEFNKLISKDCWIARKFDMNIDSQIFDMLDSYIDKFCID